MKEEKKSYICIELKSFDASAEFVDAGLDSLDTHLVVADESRTEKTICLAVTPALKAYGVSGRARLFEVMEAVRKINQQRQAVNGGRPFSGESSSQRELMADPSLKLKVEIAPPRMRSYMEKSRRIYEIYMHFVAPEDMHVYSIDEVFMDVTAYLQTYRMDAAHLASRMISEVQKQTGITATGGVGTNLYLAKVAMDVMAKHMKPNEDGVRIATLDEVSYRKLFWSHTPITDFWRIGPGYRNKLASLGLYTLGDVAKCSVGGADDYYNEALLYRTFGKNAELLIDHAWGYEPCEISHIKAYIPRSNSISNGQVLSEPYAYDKAKLIVREMTLCI